MRFVFAALAGAMLAVALPAVDASAGSRKCVAETRHGKKVKFYCKKNETCRFSPLLSRSFCLRPLR